MTDSSSGNYTLPAGYLAVTGQTVLSTQHNPPLEDIAAALNRRHFSDGRKPFLGDQNLNGYRVTGAGTATDPADLVSLAQVQALIAASGAVPTGTLIPQAGVQVPAGYLAANGQAVSRTTYAALWTYAQASANLAVTQGAKTPGQFGPGDGTTTFTLPDLTVNGGQFIRPLAASGRAIGSSQTDDIEAHLHTATFAGTPEAPHVHGPGAGSSIWSGGAGGGTSVQVGAGVEFFSASATAMGGGHTPAGTVAVASTGGTETRPVNIAYPYVIKT